MKGFTLIEVLVAVSILAVISLLIWQSSGVTLVSKERFELQEEAIQSGSLSIQQITRDLESAALYFSIDFLGRSANGDQRTKTVFIGKDEGDQDRLTFFTLAHVRYLKDSKESDQAEVSYSVETGGEELLALKKRESSPPDAEPEEGGEAMTLMTGLKRLNFRYYDDRHGEFVDSWDSTGVDQLGRLPRAVEISLVVQDPVFEEAEIKFLTKAFLGMAPGPNDF